MTDALPFTVVFAVAVPIVGGSGVVGPGVMTSEGSDHGPLPAALTARTLNV